MTYRDGPVFDDAPVLVDLREWSLEEACPRAAHLQRYEQVSLSNLNVGVHFIAHLKRPL